MRSKHVFRFAVYLFGVNCFSVTFVDLPIGGVYSQNESSAEAFSDEEARLPAKYS